MGNNTVAIRKEETIDQLLNFESKNRANQYAINMDNLDVKGGSNTRKYYLNHQNQIDHKNRYDSEKYYSQVKAHRNNFDIVGIFLNSNFYIQIKDSENLLKEYRDYKSSKERESNEPSQTNCSFDRNEDQNQRSKTNSYDNWNDKVDDPWNFSSIAYPRAKQPEIRKVEYEAQKLYEKDFKPVILRPELYQNSNEKANVNDY